MHKARKNILIVDDDRNFCLSLSEYLRSDEVEIHVAHSGKDGLALCEGTLIDVVLLDQKLPDAEGSDLCASILNRSSQTKIIFTTAFPSFDNAVQAIRQGAFDYLSKPFELGELDLVLKQALRTLDLEKVEQFRNYQSDRKRDENVLVGQSALIDGIRRLIDLAAPADAPVLITGETGTGKNVAACAIHYQGPLQHEPFISINCATLPENLIEAELFGYEKGAFTGATGLKKGMFEMAEGGTIFLDEIGELPMPLQAKLLGVLDNSTYRRLGGTTLLRAQVRVIAATSVDLEKAILKKQFRKDLFYRLGVIKIHLPPLRDRKDDLGALCGFLLANAAKGRQVLLAADELGRLMHYNWPGNVRELKNIFERALILQHGPEIRPSEFLGSSHAKAMRPARELNNTSPGSHSTSLDDMEKNHILVALEAQSGNYTRTARAIGISLSTLKRRLKQYGII